MAFARIRAFFAFLRPLRFFSVKPKREFYFGQRAFKYNLVAANSFCQYIKHGCCIVVPFFLPGYPRLRSTIVGKKKCFWTSILTWLGLWKEEEDPMITTIKRGVLCLRSSEYDKAETIFHLALKVAQERQDMKAQRYIFDLLANAAFQKGDLPKAAKLFTEVTRELIAFGTATSDNSIVEISLKLAQIYSRMEEAGKAEQGFDFCITTQEKKLKNLDLDNVESLSDEDKDTVLLWAMSVDWYARHLLAKNALSAAEENFKKALDISKKINGPSHPQTLILMNDIGSVASLQKDYDKAIKCFEHAIKTATADAADEVPAFYCNLGATYLFKGENDKAYKTCTEALSLARKVKNKEAEEDALSCLREAKLAQKAKG